MAFDTETCYNLRMEQDVFEKWQYVQKRHNKYGLWVPVPLELQDVIGKKEVTRSLGTGDATEAKRHYGGKLAEIHEQFDAARPA